MLSNNQNPDSDDLSARKVLFDFYLDEGARLHQRTDWFLIFHAILLEAYLSERSRGSVQMLVGSIGIVITYLWFATGIRHRWTFMHLGKCISEEKIFGQSISSSLKGVFDNRNHHLPGRALPWARPTSCFGIITPLVFLIAWVSLLAMAEVTSKWRFLAAAGATCLLASLVACCLGPGPKIKDEWVAAVAPKTTPGN